MIHNKYWSFKFLNSNYLLTAPKTLEIIAVHVYA